MDLTHTRSSSSVRLARTRPPALAAGLVSRRALDEWVGHVLTVPTTVIQAPAGYGKTTLLAQLHWALSQTDRETRWLSIVPSDREPQSLMSALAASCGLPELPEGESADR